MPRPAQLRALEGVTARRGLEHHRLHAAPAFGELEVDIRSNNAEAVSRVLAAQSNLETRAGFHPNLRRCEGEPLGGDLDDLRTLVIHRSGAHPSEELVHSLQKFVEVDEPEPDTVPLIGSAGASVDADDTEVAVERMTEEELLKGLEGLAPPEEQPEEDE